MRNFVLFLIRYHFALLFVALEVLSLMLIVQFNKHPGAAFFSYSTAVSGRANNTWDAVAAYFNLTDVNRRLADQNARYLIRENFSMLRRDTTVERNLVSGNK